MKKIIAIIPDECVEQTKTALEKIGICAVAVQHVRELDRQKYPISTPDSEFSPQHANYICLPQKPILPTGKESPADPVPDKQEFKRRFLPKGMLIIVVSKEKVHPVIHALITVNQSGLSGEGKIFICPMVTALEIRDYELDNTTPL